MNQLQSSAVDTSTLHKMLLAVSFHCEYRNRLNIVTFNMRIYIYILKTFIRIKEYRDYRKTRKITHDYSNNINYIGTNMRNKILHPGIFSTILHKFMRIKKPVLSIYENIT